MIDYEKLLDALQTIQNECAKYKCCTDAVQIAHSSFRVKISTAAFSLGILSTGS